MKAAMHPLSFFNNLKIIGVGLLALFFLYMIAGSNYLLFHTVAEGFAIIVTALIYVLATRTYKHSANNYLLFLGYAYLFVASFDFLHLVTYYGMGVFPNYSRDEPTQLWIVGRYFEVFSLLAAPFFINRNFPRNVLLGVYAVTAGLLIASIMRFKIFPACFVKGQGLTTFKIASEFIICFLLLAAILHLYSKRREINKIIYRIMIGSMIMTVLAEFSFIFYTDVYGIMNFIGHVFKIISYSLIYQGIVIQGIEMPYDLIFRELKTSSMTDYLTGLYNRKGFSEFTDKEMARAQREGYSIGVLYLDLDNFKNVNDRYGHLTGDQALKYFAGILKSSVREIDIAGRLGGDEFVVIAKSDRRELEIIQQRIRQAVLDWIASDDIVRDANLDISIGAALWEPGQSEDLEALIQEADREMYRKKGLKTG